MRKFSYYVLACMVFLIVVCAGAVASGANDSDTLTIALDLDITSIDPMNHNETITAFVTNMCTSRLFVFDKNLKIENELAESWKYLDDQSLQITIKKGVKFHDGSEMKAEDVAASIMRATKMPKVSYVVSAVDKVDIVNDYTVVIHTRKPFAPLMGNLIHPGCSILSKAQIDSGDFSKINGSGPYKFVKWQTGNEIILERFDDYFDNRYAGDFKRMVFKIIPEGTSRTIALEAGDVDIATTLDTIDYKRVVGNKNLKTIEILANHIFYMSMNVEKAPFNNELVRKAMNYAIDKESVLMVAENGRGETLRSITPSKILGWKDNDYSYDPAKAAALLKQAGYPGGKGLSITITTYGEDRVGPVIQANLAELGIDAKVSNMDRGAFLARVNKGDFVAALSGWTTSSDPDRFLSSLLHSRGIGSNNNARYTKADALIDQGASTINETTRKGIYNQIHEQIMADAPWVPLYSRMIIMAGVSKYTYPANMLDPVGNVQFNRIRK